jgi:hypothetical protein
MSAIAELGLDASGFMTGISNARNALQEFNAVAEKASQTEALPEGKVKKAAVGITVTIAAITAAMIKGTQVAIQFGSSLVDLSYNAGLATDQAMVLQLAVQKYGLSASTVSEATGKFNSAAADAAKGTGPLVGILQNAGIAMDDFTKMDVAKRMQVVAEAIKNIKHPTEQAQAAMALWGAEGIKFNEAIQPGKINSASAQLGIQAKLMQENAGMFARITQTMAQSGSLLAEITAGAKAKFQGFFIGMASSLAPEIISILDSLSEGTTSVSDAIKTFAPALSPLVDIVNTLINMDFAKIGQNLGKSIAVTFERIRGFNLKDIFKTGSWEETLQPAIEAVQKNQEINLEKYKTPEPTQKGLEAPPVAQAMGKGADVTAGLSSLAKMGAIGGGGPIIQDPLAMRSVSIQEDIRNYMRDLVNLVKSPENLSIQSSGTGMILAS